MAEDFSRKDFLKTTGLVGLAAAGLGLPNILLSNQKEKLGVALVGLGRYSTERLAPGLQKTEHCELRGIVTGSPHKVPKWQKKYDIPDSNVYNYENMHRMANNDDIDIIYIVTPPGLHAKYSIIGAEAGKHVWCEKPMAMDEVDCRSMIDAADKNGVSLSIGYRLQHEPNNRTIIRYGKEETYGAVEEVKSGAGYKGSHSAESWRRDAELGGGALYDMGVYPINASRYSTDMEPIAVRGKQWSERDIYNEVDEFTEFKLEFANGVKAYGETAFGKSTNYLDVDCTDGWYRLRPFQTYSGVKGETSNGKELSPNPNHQQARQMDREAQAIKDGQDPVVPGEEGLKDIRIVQAIMESSRKDETRITL